MEPLFKDLCKNPAKAVFKEGRSLGQEFIDLQEGFKNKKRCQRMDGLLSGWPFIEVVSYQGGLSSEWSFIEAFHQGGLSSKMSFT